MSAAIATEPYYAYTGRRWIEPFESYGEDLTDPDDLSGTTITASMRLRVGPGKVRPAPITLTVGKTGGAGFQIVYDVPDDATVGTYDLQIDFETEAFLRGEVIVIESVDP
jgi:hypothetical protein